MENESNVNTNAMHKLFSNNWMMSIIILTQGRDSHWVVTVCVQD